MHTDIEPAGARCLVTGANGFIGSHLCDRLIDMGCKVFALVRRSSNLKYISSPKIEFRFGELRDYQSLQKAVGDIDFIFHSAGLTKARNKSEFFQVNHLGTQTLLKAIPENRKDLNRLIYISSQAATGPGVSDEPSNENQTPDPVSAYGRSKLLGEEEVKQFAEKVPYVIIRPTSVYGPRDTEILSFFRAASWGIKPHFGNRKSILSLVFVDDLVDGIIMGAFSNKSRNQTYFISDGMVYEWSEIVDCLLAAFGKKGVKITIPVRLFHLIGWLTENAFNLVGKTPMLNKEKAFEITCDNWGCSAEKAMRDFGYSPRILFKEGAVMTAKWYKDNRWL